MTYIKFEIIPEYRFKTLFSYLLFAISLIPISFSVFTNDGGGGAFIGIIFFIIGMFYTIFTTKQYLKIDNDVITVDTKSVVKAFNNTLIINISDIEEIHYFKRWIRLGNIFARNPYADVQDLRVYNPERIVIKLEENKRETIQRIGSKEQFLRAYKIIEDSITKEEVVN